MTTATKTIHDSNNNELVLTVPGADSNASSNGNATKPKSRGRKAKGVVHVALGDRSYDIVVKRGVIREIGSEIVTRLNLPDGQGRTAAVLINPKVEHYYGKAIYESLRDAGFEPLPVGLVVVARY